MGEEKEKYENFMRASVLSRIEKALDRNDASGLLFLNEISDVPKEILEHAKKVKENILARKDAAAARLEKAISHIDDDKEKTSIAVFKIKQKAVGIGAADAAGTGAAEKSGSGESLPPSNKNSKRRRKI